MSLNPSGFGTPVTGGSSSTAATGASGLLAPSTTTPAWATGIPHYPLGKTVGANHDGSAVGPISTITGDIAYFPFYLDSAATLKRVLVSVTVAGASGISLTAGIYNDSTTSEGPGSLLTQFSTFSCVGTGLRAVSTNVPLLGRTRYWAAYTSNATNASAGPQLRALGQSLMAPVALDPGGTSSGNYIRSTGTWDGNLPATAQFDGVFKIGNAFVVALFGQFGI